MKALITGATGFIGGALTRTLLEAGWDVNVLVRPGSLHRWRSRRSDLQQWGEKLHIIPGDLVEAGINLYPAVDGCELVYHAAAIRDRWGATLSDYWQVNVEGTRRLLSAARLTGVRRFIYISSVGVLGYPGVLNIDETFPVHADDGKVGYHSTKAEAERLVRSFRGLETVIVRPSITYGPGDEDGMLTRLIEMIARGRFIPVGSGRNHLHLVYIQDLVDGLTLAGSHPAAAGETFILTGQESISVRDLLTWIFCKLGRSPARFYLPESLARTAGWLVEEVYKAGTELGILDEKAVPPITMDKVDTLCIHRGFSSRKAEETIGYRPQVDYEEGIEKTIAWMASAGRLPPTISADAGRRLLTD